MADHSDAGQLDRYPIVGVLPGGGWIAHHKDQHTPVVGWVVQADGMTNAIIYDVGGLAMPKFNMDLNEARNVAVYHRESPEACPLC
jgi:hypothetical protein